MAFAHEIETAQLALEAARASYLRRWGWVQTCRTPGAYWLWQRDFADYDAKFDSFYAAHPDRQRPAPTGAMTLPTDLAVGMTIQALDEQPELAGDAA